MLRRRYIWIVETDDLIRTLFKRWLAEAGYDVGFAAASAAKSAVQPDLVIVNVASPRGTEDLIRALEDEHGAPLLIVSARFRRGPGTAVDVAKRLGVRMVLPKPFTRKELLAAVLDSIEVDGGD